MRPESLSVRSLDGRGVPSSDGKGTIDLLCFKGDVLKWVLSNFLDQRSFPAKDKDEIRSACASIQEFRGKCGYAHNVKYCKASPP